MAEGSTARAVADWLVTHGRIDTVNLKKGREIAEGAGLPLPRALLFMRLVDPAALAAALSAVLGKRVFDLDKFTLPPDPKSGVDESVCRELRVLPLGIEAGDRGERVVVAMSDPSDQAAGVRVAALVARDVRPLLVDDGALGRAIERRFDPPPQETALLLVDLASLRSGEGPRTEVAPPPEISDEDVFDDAPRPQEATSRLKRPRATRMGEGENDTIRAPRPNVSAFDEVGQTAVSSTFKDLRVCFVSGEADVRRWVERELGPLVGKLFVVDTLQKALDVAEDRPIDDVVLHAPRNDATTGLMMDRLSRLCDDGIVVLSDDVGFSMLPCVRVRIARPPETKAITAAILDGLFSSVRGAST